MSQNTTPSDAAVKKQMSASTIMLIVAGVALLLFILQNRNRTEVSFLWITGQMPTWLLIVLVAALGAIIDRAVVWLMHHRKNKADS